MKKYFLPEIKIARFVESVNTAAASEPKTNGADIAEEAMVEKGVSTQKVDMNSVDFLF